MLALGAWANKRDFHVAAGIEIDGNTASLSLLDVGRTAAGGFRRHQREERMLRLTSIALAVALATGIAAAQTPTPAPAPAAAPDMQKQLSDIKGALPKFAIPMREVGDRFQNMYYAAKGGNWALAAYMSKYMNGAMNPAKVTKPEEYKTWASFYTGAFQPVDKAIAAKDMKAFEKAYKEAIGGCNSCHQAMGYGFIEVVPLKGPADAGMKYNKPSNPGDVPP